MDSNVVFAASFNAAWRVTRPRYTAKGVLLDSKTELLSSFERFKQALFKCDSDALRQLIAEEYRGFDALGLAQNKSVILEAYCSGGVELEAYEIEELEASVIESIGIITGKGRISGKFREYYFDHVVRFFD